LYYRKVIYYRKLIAEKKILYTRTSLRAHFDPSASSGQASSMTDPQSHAIMKDFFISIELSITV